MSYFHEITRQAKEELKAYGGKKAVDAELKNRVDQEKQTPDHQRMTGPLKDKMAEKDFPNKMRMGAKLAQRHGINPNAAKYITGKSGAMLKKDAVVRVGESVEYANQLIREYCR